MIYSNAGTKKLQILFGNRNKTGLYLWTNLKDNKKYDGSAINLSKRLFFYYSAPNLIKSNSYIPKALLSHGYSVFRLSILEYIDISNLSKEDARKIILEREQYYLDLLEPEYNILKVVGNLLGYKHSEESLAKMSLANLGENNPRGMSGRTLSTENLAKMSEAKVGEKNPRGMLGRTHSADTLTKMSIAKLGSNNPIGKRVFVYSSTTPQQFLCMNLYLIQRPPGRGGASPRGAEAAKHFNCSIMTIFRYLKSGGLFQKQWILCLSKSA